MAAQIQLANTFNEFRQAYNDAANDITALQSGNTTFNTILSGDANIYANTAQIKDFDVGGGRIVITRAPASGSGAFVDDDAGLLYDTTTNRLSVDGPVDANGAIRVSTLTANNLTSGRVAIVGTDGLVEDNAKLYFSTANNGLVAGNLAIDSAVSVAGGNVLLSANGRIVAANDLFLSGASSRIDAYHIHAEEHVAAGGDIEDWTTSKGQSADTHHIAAVGDQDLAVDMIVVNQSDGANAYAEFIAINDTGDIENGWVSMGINSSNYGQGAYAVTKADDAYILYQAAANTTANGDLVIGTGGNGTSNRIIFSANGFDDPANNTQMVIIPGVQVHIEVDTESTSVTTGALRVAGGMGLTGNLNVGGNVSIVGAITLLGSGNTVSTDSLSVSNSLLFLANGNASDSLDVGVIGEYTQGTSKYFGLVRDQSDGIFKLYQDGSTKPANNVNFGEAGINYGSVLIGALNASNTTASTDTTSGAIKTAGGLGVAGNINAGGYVKTTDSTASTSTSSGALIVAGGAGINGNTHIGSDLVVGGTASITGNTGLSGITGNFTAYGNPTFAGTTTFTGSTTFTGPVRVQELIEDVVDVSSVSNSFALDYNAGNIFYASSAPSADFLINASNVPTTDGRATTLTLILPQGATGRRPVANVININSSNVLINYVGGNTSFTPTNSKTDIFNFTILRRGGTFTVAGSVSANTVL
jgi:hypothetical protein